MQTQLLDLPILSETSENNAALHTYCETLKTRYEMNEKVLFIQIPQSILSSFDPEVARKKGYYAFPPTALQCLYESLKGRTLDFRILDLNLELLKRVNQDPTFDHTQWISLLEEYLETYDPSIIGVSCMFDAGLKPLLQVLNLLKERNRSVVITGGVIATYEWQNLLKRDACHFVVRGEAENKINFLFDHLTEENQESKATSGIYFNPNENPIETESIDGEPDIVDYQGDMLDSYKLVKIEEYHKYGSLNPFSRIAGIHKAPFAPIQLNRGCRAQCTFCAVRDFMGKGVRHRSVEDLIREMEFLIEQRGVRHFEWLDDDLLYAKENLQTVLQTIIDRKWNITWSANNGLIASAIDEKTMQLIQDSGCIGFKIGVETGNAEMLKQVRKPGTLDTFRRFASMLNDYQEVFVGGNFIVGFPEETFAQMMDSFRFYIELNLDWGAFTMCQVIRGASAFSDFDDYFDDQMASEGEKIKNFIPSRDSKAGHVEIKDNVISGLDVFGLPEDQVPSEEQVREICFTFNLVGNFICNKNLMPGGRPRKFISWVEMAQAAYPTNPYMSLFLALAYTLEGNQKESQLYLEKAVTHHQTEYWMERFQAFGLTDILTNFPQTSQEVYQTVQGLKTRSFSHIKDQ
jgi:radical SAM superfamily enzyme YgiQ (UPF0313 family)